MSESENRVSLMGAISIGVGGMVGGGIFAVLGLAAVQAGGATPIAFLVAGVVALLTAYSYAKMSVTYPSRGGTVMIVDKAFGKGFLTGSVNSLLWIAYVVTLALYAVAFGNYAATFFAESSRTGLLIHLLISLGLILPTVLNLAGAELISKAETYIVGLKLLLLMVVIVFGVGSVETSHLALSTWEAPLQIVSAGMMIFVAYEGFELIANTAEEIVDYKRTLPRAYYISVLFVIVIYVLIAVVVVGSLTPQKIASAEDFALAQAAKPSLGEAGFTLVAVAAVLATLSAINSTLYGAGRLSYTIATEGELPEQLTEQVWGQPVGLFLTAASALVLANTVDLSSISTMGSAAFLIVFAVINLANLVRRQEAGSSAILAFSGFACCLAALATLVWYTLQNDPWEVLFLVGMVGLAMVIEGVYRWKADSISPRLKNQ